MNFDEPTKYNLDPSKAMGILRGESEEGEPVQYMILDEIDQDGTLYWIITDSVISDPTNEHHTITRLMPVKLVEREDGVWACEEIERDLASEILAIYVNNLDLPEGYVGELSEREEES